MACRKAVGKPAPAIGRRGGRPERDGFALLVVLWTLVLIAFIVAHLTASGRTEIRIASNLAANAAARAAADGAIYQAIFNLSSPRPEARWPVDGSTREVRVGDSRVAVQIEDEASRIDPNTASPTLLAALLETTGAPPETAHRLGVAISEWVGNAESDARAQERIAADYRAAGLNYAPPGEPLESIGELGHVLGMTPEALSAIRPHLTLYADITDPAHADPVVAAAIALAARRTPEANAPPPLAAGGRLLTARITATAQGPGNARVGTVAVVRVGAALPNGYAILARDSGVE